MPVHNQFLLDANNSANPEVLTHVGAFSPIEIHVPPQIATVLADQNQPIPTPVPGFALIDTGATITCAHEPVLQQLGLSPIGIINTGTAGGPVQQSLYPARLVFPTKGWTVDLTSAIGVNLAGQQVPVDPPQDIIVLIGRNVLQNWILIWNGPGGFWTVAM